MTHLKKLSRHETPIVAFMSIKPVYAERIIAGEKLYEFRKTAIRNDLSHIVIYATSPVKKIMGVAEVQAVHALSPTAAWEMTKSVAGISRRLFREYFKGRSTAYAIEIKKVLPLKEMVDPDEIENGLNIPQSFSYINESLFYNILKLVR